MSNWQDQDTDIAFSLDADRSDNRARPVLSTFLTSLNMFVMP